MSVIVLFRNLTIFTVDTTTRLPMVNYFSLLHPMPPVKSGRQLNCGRSAADPSDIDRKLKHRVVAGGDLGPPSEILLGPGLCATLVAAILWRQSELWRVALPSKAAITWPVRGLRPLANHSQQSERAPEFISRIFAQMDCRAMMAVSFSGNKMLFSSVDISVCAVG
jgi:hypothetical protein